MQALGTKTEQNRADMRRGHGAEPGTVLPWALSSYRLSFSNHSTVLVGHSKPPLTNGNADLLRAVSRRWPSGHSEGGSKQVPLVARAGGNSSRRSLAFQK